MSANPPLCGSPQADAGPAARLVAAPAFVPPRGAVGRRGSDVLVLFGADWDRCVLPRYARGGRLRFHEHGFDLFRFPSNARLMWFDLWRFIERLASRYRGRVDAVFSSNEQFGALAASLLARELGLPGLPPEVLLATQHKYEARCRLARFAPELCPAFRLLPYTVDRKQAEALRYPLFVKPVKATFSVLARRCDSADELLHHVRFGRWESHLLGRLVAPHDQALGRFPQFGVGARHLIVEEVLRGRQVNVDGYVDAGAVHLLGMTDELMYPGTIAFRRFAFPARLDDDLRERLRAASEKVVHGYGIDHGFFNLEFCVDDVSGAIGLVEINPRMAAQLAPFYDWVLGIDAYEISFALALGRRVPAPRAARFGAAASFVWRSREPSSCPRLPSAEDRAWLAREYPQARLEVYAKRGAALHRDLKWLGSHRWAVLNLPGHEEADLHESYLRICRRLRWPALDAA
ncbi:MAG: ATP-grasp domain-containing protein [Betaproteobacteria bacterium]